VRGWGSDSEDQAPVIVPNIVLMAFGLLRVRTAVNGTPALGLLHLDDPTSAETARWSHECHKLALPRCGIFNSGIPLNTFERNDEALRPSAFGPERVFKSVDQGCAVGWSDGAGGCMPETPLVRNSLIQYSAQDYSPGILASPISRNDVVEAG
jgi:hypothetical protein